VVFLANDGPDMVSSATPNGVLPPHLFARIQCSVGNGNAIDCGLESFITIGSGFTGERRNAIGLVG
jgi:hypothetical protein